MAVSQGSTLYNGSVSADAIYQIMSGEGLTWGEDVRTEFAVDGKPRQLTKASHAGNPIVPNVPNPRNPADFPAGTTVLIDGRQVSVTDFMVTDFWDNNDWKETFPKFQPSGLSVDLKSNPIIAKTILDQTMNAASTQLNLNHSVGDTLGLAPANLYDGFETLILADVDTTQVGAPAVISSANVLDIFFGLRNALPPRLRKNKSLKMFCSYEDGDLFDVAARNTQDAQVITGLGGIRSITQTNGGAIPIIQREGMRKNFVFATIADKTAKSNLVQAVWVERDLDTLKVYREFEVDQIWNLLMRFSIGVQYKTGEDIFYHNDI